MEPRLVNSQSSLLSTQSLNCRGVFLGTTIPFFKSVVKFFYESWDW